MLIKLSMLCLIQTLIFNKPWMHLQKSFITFNIYGFWIIYAYNASLYM